MNKVCKDCGTVGPTERVTKGSIWIEIILWLCFLIPGFLYSVWRLTSRHDACATCGSKNMVPLDSPIGRKVAADSGYTIPPQRMSGAESFGRSLGRVFASKKQK